MTVICERYAAGLCGGLRCSERCGEKQVVDNPLPEMNTHMLGGELDRTPYFEEKIPK